MSDRAIDGCERVATLVDDLRSLLPPDALITDRVALGAYACDGMSDAGEMPAAVVLPHTAAEVSLVLTACAAIGVPFVPRGAGTGGAGGARPVPDGIVIGLARLNRIVSVDAVRRCASVEPGVTARDLAAAAAGAGLRWMPDPRGRIAGTLGGALARDAIGPHGVKYGSVGDQLIGAELALPGGERVRLGGLDGFGPRPDLLALLPGSEGRLGIVTELTLRLAPPVEVTHLSIFGFAALEDAGALAGQLAEAGLVPAALELLDRRAVAALTSGEPAGLVLPAAAEAVLIVAFDGTAADVAQERATLDALAATALARHRADVDEPAVQASVWAACDHVLPALARTGLVAGDLCGILPRLRLAEALARLRQIADRHGVPIAVTGHIGTGHLDVLMPAADPAEAARRSAFAADVRRLFAALGGVPLGADGIGLDHRQRVADLASADDRALRRRLFAAFDPAGLANPGKLLAATE